MVNIYRSWVMGTEYMEYMLHCKDLGQAVLVKFRSYKIDPSINEMPAAQKNIFHEQCWHLRAPNSPGCNLDKWPVRALSQVDMCTWTSDCHAPGQVVSPTDLKSDFWFWSGALVQVACIGTQPSDIPHCLRTKNGHGQILSLIIWGPYNCMNEGASTSWKVNDIKGEMMCNGPVSNL